MKKIRNVLTCPSVTSSNQIPGGHSRIDGLNHLSRDDGSIQHYDLRVSADVAFARDNGLPFSGFFSQINTRLHIPLNALLLDTMVAVLLLLVAIGSTTAFFAIVSLSTLALYISYIIPLLFFFIAKLRNQDIPYGPFRFQSRTLGLVVNVFALIYSIFIAIFLPFPPRLPVTGSTMNYAGPLMGAVIVWALVDWSISGHKRWKAPTDRKDVEEEEEEEGGD